MIETCHLKNGVIFIQTSLSFVLSRKIEELREAFANKRWDKFVSFF